MRNVTSSRIPKVRGTFFYLQFWWRSYHHARSITPGSFATDFADLACRFMSASLRKRQTSCVAAKCPAVRSKMALGDGERKCCDNVLDL